MPPQSGAHDHALNMHNAPDAGQGTEGCDNNPSEEK